MALTTVTGSLVSVNAIQGTLIADNAITAVHIATNAVSGTLIADNAITAVHIAQNSITVTQLADDCVESDKIADGIITTNHLNKAMISSQTEVTAATGDFVLLGDTSDSNNLKKTPVSSIIGLASGTTINNNADNRIITGSGTANTLNGEANLTFDSSLVITKSEGAANSLNDQISLEHTSGTTGYHIKTIRAATTDNPDGIAFVENTTERMRIRGENVLIGATSPISANAQRLQISNAGATAVYQSSIMLHSNQNDGNANVTRIGWSGGDGASSTRVFSSIEGGKENSTSGEYGGMVSLSTRPHGGTITERMRIDSSGRVGIGTNDPGTGYGGAITAAKVAILSGAAGSNGGSSTLLIGGDDKHYAYMQGTHTSSGNTQLDFGTANGANNPTQRATLNEWGGWKVKSTSGAYFNIISKYHEICSNDGALTTVLIRNGSTYYASCANFWLYGGAPNNTQSNFWTCNDTAGQKASIQSNGGFYNYQSNNSNLCDEREKKNIEVLPSTWNSVKSWNLKKFHYNEDADSDDKRLGVIAQEIETTNPELITAHTRVQAKDAVLWTEEDDLPEGVSIGDTKTAAQDAVVRKGVKEQQMYIMAIKALQEAMTEIESLKARIETLEG